jgi:hypothetical protein
MRRAMLAAAALGSLGLAACSDVLESNSITLAYTSTGERQTCLSSLGSYSLPKAMLHIKVQQGDGPATLIPFGNDSSKIVEVIRRPDPSLFFCLDYLNSATTTDKISIKKWANPAPSKDEKALSSPFLGAVTVNSTDQSVYIINALLRSLFILVTGNPNFKPRLETAKAAVTVADLEFDPFDPRESAVVNQRLHQLGYCLVLESYTFNRNRFSVDQYCNAPERVGPRPTMVAKAYQRASEQPANPHLPGLMYRPRHPYRLAIYRKADPGGRGGWHLARTTTVELENLSPVLSLDIRRAAFGARTANFVFNEGTLLTASVTKTSDIEGAVQIPLQIAKSIVEVPASIISIRIDQFKNRAELVTAQANLYKVQQAYLAALTSRQFQSPADPKDYKAPDITLDLTPPGDLAPRGDAPGYGTDLFDQNLATLCSTGASS